MEVLKKAWVPEDMPVETLAAVAATMFIKPTLFFTDSELAPPERRTLPLNVTVIVNHYKLSGVLVDTGATLNVCSLDTLHLIGFKESQLNLAALTVSGYDNNKKAAQGKINVKIAVGPIEVDTELIVVDAPISYRLILGCQWIEEIKAVTSPRHQCLKYPYQRKIIKIMGDEPMEVEAHLVVVPTTTPAWLLIPESKNPVIEARDSVKQIFSPRSIDMNQYDFPEHMKRLWEILLKIGYTPGKGLGRQEQGMKDAFETPEERNGTGLGYSGYSVKDLEKPLTWSLSNHFISVGLQFKDKSTPKEVPNSPEEPEAATLISSPNLEEIPDIALQVSDNLPHSPQIPPLLDIPTDSSSKASSENVEAEVVDSLSLSDLTSLFRNLWLCPSEQEGAGATD